MSIRKILKLSEEEKKELVNKRLEKRESLTLAYQLGYYIGEEIVNRFLPTLSCDSIHTNNNISVTCAEGDECRRLNDVWFNKTQEVRYNLNKESREKQDGKKSWEIDDESRKATEKEWEELRAYHKMLEEKYLPKTLECKFQILNINPNDMDEFKKGISHSLWNCDCSHYSTKEEEIVVEADEEGWFTVITLKKS